MTISVCKNLTLIEKTKRIGLLLFFFLVAQFSYSQITADVTDGCAPLTVKFTHITGASNDSWQFGDASSSNLPTPTHIYSVPGTYTVNYTGTNGGAVSGSMTITVHPKPTAKFTAVPTHGCIPLAVQFTDQSTGGGGSAVTGWQWTYGDGGSNNTTQNPLYSFSLVGSFNVILIATDANGCSDDTVWTTPIVTTNNPPNANFTASATQSCTAPLTVTFNSTSTNGNGGVLSWNWDFGNGTTSTLEHPAAVTYNTVGNYFAKLVVSESNGCSDSLTVPIIVNKPLASFSMTNDTICPFFGYQFTNLSLGATSYAWDFGNGKVSNQINPVTGYSVPGTYNVKLTASANGCSDDTTIAVVVENVVANFSRVPSYYCDFPMNVQYTDLSSPDIISWAWTFGDTKTSNQQNPSHSFQKPDGSEYTVYDPIHENNELIVTSAQGCKDTIVKTDTIWPIVGRLQPDVAEGCVPLTVNFSDSSRSKEPITAYKWRFGDGDTSIVQNPTHTYVAVGEYKVTVDVTNSAGCRDTSYEIVIRVGEPTSPNFSISPATVCPQDTVTLTNLTTHDSTDTWHYTADASNLSSCPGDASVKWLFGSVTGPQDITLTTGFNGCYADTTIQNAVMVNGPIAHLKFSALCVAPMDYTFVADTSDADSWTWIFGEGGVGDTIKNSTDTLVTHTYAGSGNYWARIIAHNNTSGCADFVDSVLVKVRDIKALITQDSVICEKVPHTFNAAGSSDVFSACNNGYRWDWGDGSPPDLNGINTYTHTYADTGVYSIRLITTAETGCKDTNFFDVKVFGIKADFLADKITGCLPLTVNFTDQSVSDTTVTQWTWKWADGTLNGTTQNPSHTYFGGSPSYTVKLIAQDALGCIDSTTKVITPYYPAPNFTGPTQVCTGTPHATVFNATGTNLASYSWNFNDGTGLQSGNNITHAFSPAGSYAVKLVVTDTHGCMDSITKNNYVQVQDYPVAAFTSDADNVSPLCYPKQISFTDISTGNVASRSWDLANGSPTLPVVTVSTTYNAPGVYNAKLTVTSSFGCADDTIRPFNVVGPVADFTLSKSLICVGDDVTLTMTGQVDVDSWEWDFGGVVEQGGNPKTHKFDFYPPGGVNNVTLVVYSLGKACFYPIIKPLNFHATHANFGLSDTTLCVGQTLTVTDSSAGADTYQWVVTPGSTYSSQNFPAQSFATAGNYTISSRVSDVPFGCKDTMTKSFVVNPLPSFTVNNATICQGASATLTATNNVAYTYSWTPTTNLSAPTSSTTLASPPSTQVYTATVTVAATGCTDSKNSTVTVYGPITNFPFDTACIAGGQTITLGQDLGPNYVYSWTTGTTKGLSCTDCPITKAKITEDATFKFVVTDVNSCYSSTSTYVICILPDHTLDVPSAFTPNDDGVNDVVYADGWGVEKLLHFRIFNRWGELIFETDDIKVGWNGNYKGSPQPNDSYVYQVDAVFYGGETKTKTGSITLIR